LILHGWAKPVGMAVNVSTAEVPMSFGQSLEDAQDIRLLLRTKQQL